MLQAVNSKDWMAAPRTSLGRWRNFMSLPKRHRAVLLRAVALLPLVAAGLRLRGFGPVQANLAQIAGRLSRSSASTPHAIDVETVTGLVDLAARKGLVRANCLERSLALWFLLRREGIETDLRVGVRRRSNAEPAMFHAWIEHQNRVINDAPDVSDQYQPFRLSLMPRGAGFD